MKKTLLSIIIILCGYGLSAQTPKYVFLFIGDGMGLAQVSAAEAYLAAKDNVVGNKYVSFSKFPVIGLTTTFSASSYVTCSSAAGTALSTGFKTNNGMLGVNPAGEKLTAITYKIQAAGYKIGVASSVGIDHATPAAFYASSLKRSSYYDIAGQLPGTKFNFFGSGGFIEPKGKKGDRPDLQQAAIKAGYTIVRQPSDIKAGQDKVILFQAEEKGAELPYAIDRKAEDLSLPQITDAAIKVLNNEKGFFVMIEGGKIDWAGHANDAATNILETIDFSNAVQVAIAFYNQHPNETLIVVTADHETGGMGLNIDKEANLLDVDKKAEHKAVDTKTYMDKAARQEAERAAMAKQSKEIGISWTTNDHTGIAVPVYAIGAGSELFNGKMDNTDIPKKICQAMQVKF